MIRKSVYAASALHCLCVRLHHPTYSSWVALALALPDTNASILPAYSRFLNRSRYIEEGGKKCPFAIVDYTEISRDLNGSFYCLTAP